MSKLPLFSLSWSIIWICNKVIGASHVAFFLQSIRVKRPNVGKQQKTKTIWGAVVSELLTKYECHTFLIFPFLITTFSQFNSRGDLHEEGWGVPVWVGLGRGGGGGFHADSNSI